MATKAMRTVVNFMFSFYKNSNEDKGFTDEIVYECESTRRQQEFRIPGVRRW